MLFDSQAGDLTSDPGLALATADDDQLAPRLADHRGERLHKIKDPFRFDQPADEEDAVRFPSRVIDSLAPGNSVTDVWVLNCEDRRVSAESLPLTLLLRREHHHTVDESKQNCGREFQGPVTGFHERGSSAAVEVKDYWAATLPDGHDDDNVAGESAPIVARLNDRDVELTALHRSTDCDNIAQPLRRLCDESFIIAPTSPRFRHNNATKRAKDRD